MMHGRFMYVDDLVVTADQQRQRLGARLLASVRQQARERECNFLVLDTGLHLALAQRFYFRQGLLARGMNFAQDLSDWSEGTSAP